MHAQAHAVSAPDLTPERAPRLERSKYGARAYIPALRQGPALRKLLGPSASELWGRLQTRAFRSKDYVVLGTLRELGGRRASERTTSWCLRRLVAAGVISKIKTREGLAIQVLAFDRDQWGNGEFSPYLSPSTLRWMATRRPPGRPRKPKEPMRPPEPQPIRRPPPAPEPPPDIAARVKAYPFMPPDPRGEVEKPPQLPRPPLLDPGERTSTHREILIELFVTAARVYWPRASVARAVQWMRTRIGQHMLTGAAETFIAERAPPAMWVKHECERALPERKTPIRPEVLFDPDRLAQWLGHACGAQREMLNPRLDQSAEFRVFREGRESLVMLYRQAQRDVFALPDPTNEAAARAVVERLFPGGWEHVYHAADAKMRELQATLDARAASGKFLWGPHRG